MVQIRTDISFFHRSGPCPPCPQTVRSVCHCGNAPAKLLRCGNRKWSCGKLCGKTLNCSEHVCKLPCHEGDCPPCNKKSTRRCRCGAEEALRPCSDPPFDCGRVCGKPFACGHHFCQKVCHGGQDCGPCPLTNRRSCPCGKKEVSNVSCTAEIPGNFSCSVGLRLLRFVNLSVISNGHYTALLDSSVRLRPLSRTKTEVV